MQHRSINFIGRGSNHYTAPHRFPSKMCAQSCSPLTARLSITAIPFKFADREPHKCWQWQSLQRGPNSEHQNDWREDPRIQEKRGTSIQGRVLKVTSIKLQGVHISEKITWSLNRELLIKEYPAKALLSEEPSDHVVYQKTVKNNWPPVYYRVNTVERF